MQLFKGLVLTVAFCISSGEVKLLSMTEGEQVPMECNFTTSSGNRYRFYWYRQKPGSALQFILYRGSSSQTANFAKQRFDATADESSGKTTLKISNLIPEDSALYYCALRRTGYAEKLNFGSDVYSLTVVPTGNPREPVLTILDNPGQPSVCLATGFFPQKKGPMDLMPEGGPKQRLSTDLAALSSDKKYVYVGLSNSEKSLENCSMAGSKAEKEAPMPEPEATVPVISTIKEDQCNITAADLKRNSTKNNDSPKVNFMSLVVTCLRIVFAKTVAFNVLITLKAVVF